MFLCDECGRQMIHGRAGEVRCFACGRTDSTLWRCTKCQVTFQILPNGLFRCSRCGYTVANPDTNPDLPLPLPLPQKKALSFLQKLFFKILEIKEFLKDLEFGLVVLRSLRR